MIILDGKTGEQTTNDPMGQSVHIPWPRVVALLRAAPEIAEGLTVTHVVIGDAGATFRVKGTPAAPAKG